MKARNGNITRRPRHAREELNECSEAAQAFGCGELGGKLTKYTIQVENDAPRSKSVKPTRKQWTVQRARKTKPDGMAKPLEESEIGSPRRSRFGEGGSNPVKVNQSGSKRFSQDSVLLSFAPFALGDFVFLLIQGQKIQANRTNLKQFF
jgi:hypothetical protein